VFIEGKGLLEFVPGRVLEPRHLTVALKNIARACGDEISAATARCTARRWVQGCGDFSAVRRGGTGAHYPEVHTPEALRISSQSAP
jgi:hypothetical protein